MKMSEIEGRRPLKVRSSIFSQNIAKWLSRKSITPNQISVFSVVFALLAASCLFLLPYVDGINLWLMPIVAAVFIQCRLLCNLFDGMVAVEGGKSTASGELFNDIPDRIADPLILVAAGYATTAVDWSTSLGWAAGLLAVLTAYIRTLSVSIGAPANFGGPMAKQHRMALLTVACVITAMEPLLWMPGLVIPIALVIVIIGCVFTVFNRTLAAYTYLEKKDDV
ncbi:MAG: phosphatidylglycerophosphate synthase [Candidatus Endobugula sp.]|jgi:phosphatidylglycerophosphate synthase